MCTGYREHQVNMSEKLLIMSGDSSWAALTEQISVTDLFKTYYKHQQTSEVMSAAFKLFNLGKGNSTSEGSSQAAHQCMHQMAHQRDAAV